MKNSIHRKFSRKWFIEKFNNIPEDEWTHNILIDDEGKKCSLGHCGLKKYENPTKESLALLYLIGGPRVTIKEARERNHMVMEDFQKIYSVNDKKENGVINPKLNIINYLKNL